MRMKRGCAVIILCLLCSLPTGAQEDAAFDRWRHLDMQTQQEILAFARRAFDAYITQHKIIAPPISLPAVLSQRMGVFVSAMRNGAPRCCMGTLYPTQSNAALEIIENAVAAAGRDRRFAPIKPAEAHNLILIVSVVGKPIPITPLELTRLDPARDGLVVKSGDRYGVVLSGETGQTERMLQWGRIRAGAGVNAPVELFRLQVTRFVEKSEDQKDSKDGVRAESARRVK